MHHGHSLLFTACLLFALFYGLLLLAAYLPDLLRASLRNRYGSGARSPRASGGRSHATVTTLPLTATYTVSNAQRFSRADFIHGPQAYREHVRTQSPMRSGAVTVLPRGSHTTDAKPRRVADILAEDWNAPGLRNALDRPAKSWWQE